MLNATEAHEATRNIHQTKGSFQELQVESGRIRSEFIDYLCNSYASEYNTEAVSLVLDNCYETIQMMEPSEVPVNTFKIVESIFIDRMIMVHSFIEAM